MPNIVIKSDVKPNNTNNPTITPITLLINIPYMKIISILLAVLLTGCSTVYKPSLRESAVADTVSTAIALEYGNNLREVNPMGFPMTIVGKVGIIYYAENYAESELRKSIEKYGSSFWSGAAVNNILIMVTSPQISLLLGVITTFYLLNSQ
jgi:hypothetical protein